MSFHMSFKITFEDIFLPLNKIAEFPNSLEEEMLNMNRYAPMRAYEAALSYDEMPKKWIDGYQQHFSSGTIHDAHIRDARKYSKAKTNRWLKTGGIAGASTGLLGGALLGMNENIDPVTGMAIGSVGGTGIGLLSAYIGRNINKRLTADQILKKITGK